MPPPNDATVFRPGVELIRNADNSLTASHELVELLVRSRSDYSWPAHIEALQSQRTIIDLEASVRRLLDNLSPINAHAICCQVSTWAGNNALAHTAIENATSATQAKMQSAIDLLGATGGSGRGLDALSDLPGISLVIASKINRFCYPQGGASVDRHTSYFFNSLDMVAPDQRRNKATRFLREFSTAPKITTRLATFTPQRYLRNREEYTDNYLPLLSHIAEVLNAIPERYICVVTGESKDWRPTDIEMAAYFWWAHNGPR